MPVAQADCHFRRRHLHEVLGTPLESRCVIPKTVSAKDTHDLMFPLLGQWTEPNSVAR